MEVSRTGIPTQGLAAKAADLSGLELSKVSRAREAAGAGDADRAAEMFEDLLATTLVRELRRGLSDGFFGSGSGSDVYEGWLDEHVGKALSRSHALDIAQSIRLSLGSKQQDASR
jgi:Rod binding domain-containing protein